MTNEEKLTILKHDLQILTDIHDDYLRGLLDTALALIAREGVTLQDTVEDNSLQIMYAAYLYRHRAESDNPMPRMLRFALNNRIIGGDKDVT